MQDRERIDKMVKVRLLDVVLIRYPDFEYRVEGKVYGLSQFTNGQPIITPFIEMIDFDKKIIVAGEVKYEFDKIWKIEERGDYSESDI
jgi:uncharacterized protein YlaN (UPF0358 family)